MINNEQHLEAIKRKELDSVQLLEFIKFNEVSKNERIEELLDALLAREDLDLTNEEARRAITRCLQISRGYTEYKVSEIAEKIGFNKTRTKVLIQYLIEEGKLETVTFGNTTFLAVRGGSNIE